MESPSFEFAEELTGEIIDRDFYGVRDYPHDAFDHILDLGANIGVFSVMCRHLFPRATIIAVEAEPTIANFLRSNVNNLGVQVVDRPVGDGSEVAAFGRFDVNHGCTIFGTGPGDKVETVTLTDLVEGWDLSCTLIKIDIEGAERILFNDEDAIEIIKQCKLVTGETHYGPAFRKNGVGWSSFEACDNNIQTVFAGMQIENVNRHARKDTTVEEASGLLKMSSGERPAKTWVGRCPRCLSDHHVETFPLSGNPDGYDRWAICPKTGQPFFLKPEGKTY